MLKDRKGAEDWHKNPH